MLKGHHAHVKDFYYAISHCTLPTSVLYRTGHQRMLNHTMYPQRRMPFLSKAKFVLHPLFTFLLLYDLFFVCYQALVASDVSLEDRHQRMQKPDSSVCGIAQSHLHTTRFIEPWGKAVFCFVNLLWTGIYVFIAD